jgi:hypothetical protein
MFSEGCNLSHDGWTHVVVMYGGAEGWCSSRAVGTTLDTSSGGRFGSRGTIGGDGQLDEAALPWILFFSLFRVELRAWISYLTRERGIGTMLRDRGRGTFAED